MPTTRITTDANVLSRMWQGSTVPTDEDELAKQLFANRLDNNGARNFAGCIADEVLGARGIVEWHLSEHVLEVAVALWTRENPAADQDSPFGPIVKLSEEEAEKLARLFIELARCTGGDVDDVDTSRTALEGVARSWFDDYADDRKVLAHAQQHDLDFVVTWDGGMTDSLAGDGCVRAAGIKPQHLADKYAAKRDAA